MASHRKKLWKMGLEHDAGVRWILEALNANSEDAAFIWRALEVSISELVGGQVSGFSQC